MANQRVRAGVCLACSLVALLLPMQDARGASTESHELMGTWQLVYAESDGKPTPAERIQNIRVVIGESTHSVYIGEQEIAHNVSFTIDQTANPKTTEDTLNEGADRGKKILGIYRLDGDTLTSCVGGIDKDRPNEFATSPGSGVTLRVFRRVREGEDPGQSRIRDELIRLSGIWEFGPGLADGIATNPEARAGVRLKVMGDQFILDDPMQGIDRGSFTVDPSQCPKTVVIRHLEGPLKGRVARGLYEIDGDVFRICVPLGESDPPTELKAGAGSGHALQELRRIKP